MKYMLLIYGPPDSPGDPNSLGPDQFTDWADCSKAMEAEGIIRGGDGLQGVETATTVRVRGGESLVTDGPFAETKEHLLGYYVIEVADLDQAIAWAGRLPNASWGATEVRPVLAGGAT